MFFTSRSLSTSASAIYLNILELVAIKNAKAPNQMQTRFVSNELHPNTATIQIINSTHCNCDAHECFDIQRNNFIWYVFLFGQRYWQVIVGLPIANHRDDVIHAVLIIPHFPVYVWLMRTRLRLKANNWNFIIDTNLNSNSFRCAIPSRWKCGLWSTAKMERNLRQHRFPS